MSANAANVAYARSTGRPRPFALDHWVVATVAGLLLIGLIMVASASVSISAKEMGEPFSLFERQLFFVVLGLIAAVVGVTVPTRLWENYAIHLMVAAFVMLVLVLIPGIGHEVNGSRRWIRLGIMNFQISELTRVMLLTYIASYAVRRSGELCADIKGFL